MEKLNAAIEAHKRACNYFCAVCQSGSADEVLKASAEIDRAAEAIRQAAAELART